MAEFQLYMFLRMFVDQTVHAILPKGSWNILKLFVIKYTIRDRST